MGFWSKNDLDVPRHGNMPGDMRDIKFKHKADAGIFRSVGKTNFLLNVLENWLKIAKWSGAVVWHPLLKPKNNHWYNMPVNVELRNPAPSEVQVGKAGPTGSDEAPRVLDLDIDLEAQAMPLSADAVRKLIDEAEYITLLDRCLCRHGRNCQNHRHDIGCMFLGSSGMDVTPEFSHVATKEEAYAHLQAGLDDGLMPMAGRIRVDNWAFILPDHHSLIGVCMCCECCCFMSFYRDTPTPILDQIYDKMPGTRLVTDPNKCVGCGTCAQHCYLNAITVENGISVTSDTCRACGRCVKYCKQGARHLVGTDPDYAMKTVEELMGRADIKSAPGEEARVRIHDVRK